MENKHPKKPLQSPEAKELQRYFNRTKLVLLIPKGNEGKLQTSGLGLLFDKETYNDFKLYHVKKTFQQLFANKYPILIISVRDGTAFAGLAIRDLSSPLKFTFADQPVGSMLYKFMESTPEGAEIEMTMGYTDGDEITFEPEKEAHHLLMLKGYYFDHVI